MRKIELNSMTEIKGGDKGNELLSGLACGIGIGLLLTGVGSFWGAVAVASGCSSVIGW